MNHENGVPSLLPTPQNGRIPAASMSNGYARHITKGHHQKEPYEADQLAAIWERRAVELAVPLHEEPEGATLDLLVFCLNGERYGIKVSHVREIHQPQQITTVPRTPEFVVGVFSARGRLLSIIDLHAFLGLPKITLNKDSKIIVVTSNDQTHSSDGQFEIGLLADEVEDVLTIFEDDLNPMLANQLDGQAEYTLGITVDMLIVFNLGALLKNKRLLVNEEI